jgi:hypothetical protein
MNNFAKMLLVIIKLTTAKVEGCALNAGEHQAPRKSTAVSRDPLGTLPP